METQQPQPLAKTYDPSAIEAKWYRYWIENGHFDSDPDPGREPYTIVIPPPNVTGVLHMGHMLNNTIQDVLVRRKRMEGYNALWVPGTDHASIATESRVVRMLREQGISKANLTRAEFLAHAWEWKEKYGGIILEQLKRLGASCDWRRTRFTMDEKLTASVLRVFVDLYNKGLLYRALRMTNWDPAGRTALSDEEVIMKPVEGKLFHVRYAVEGEPGGITIATTRPETILADAAIAVHPEDDRFAHLVGRRAFVPLTNRAIPIIADAYVEKDFGTGCLKVTPAHDRNDYEIGQRHGLPTLDILTEAGAIVAEMPHIGGMDRFEARRAFVKLLEDAGQLVKTEATLQNLGFSERTDAVVEPRLTMQWWVRMQDLAKPALKAVLAGDVKLIPERFFNTYRLWVENVRDWCISRQLWWGQRIPAYYFGEGPADFVVASTQQEAHALAIAKGFKGTADELRQDEDVLDTWFSSWLWPISVFDGLEDPDNPDFKYYYPTQDLVTAPEILFFWVARMIIAGYEWAGEKPFTNVYLTGIVRDEMGRKMSKSLGNSPDVLRLVEQFGADSIRMGLMMISAAGNDILYDVEGHAPAVQGRNFCNKIWNALRLVDALAARREPDSPISEMEKLASEWMGHKIDLAHADVAKLFSEYRLSEIATTLYKLMWDDFCSNYLEMLKPAPGGGISDDAFRRVKNHFGELVALLHPFMPFITEEVWHRLEARTPNTTLCRQPLVVRAPAPEAQEAVAGMAEALAIVSAIRGFRGEKNIPPRERFELSVTSPKPAALERNACIIAHLAGLEAVNFMARTPQDAHVLVVGVHELGIPHSAAPSDVAAERNKLEAEHLYLTGFLESVRKKLGNEKFTSNAKPEVVAAERKKEADAQAKIAVIEASLQRM